MYVRTLSLQNFRNFTRLELELPRGPILIQGANGQGKTSLLEAVSYLATARSPLTNRDVELINWMAVQPGSDYAHLRAEIARSTEIEQIEITLMRKAAAGGGGQTSKRVRIDRRPVRQAALAGHLNVVLFLPQDVELVSGAPALRRRYMDDALSQVDPAYAETLAAFDQTLRQRNALLRHLNDDGGDPGQLAPLDAALAQQGVRVALRRQEFVAALSRLVDLLHRDLTGSADWLQLIYQPSFDVARPLTVDYQMQLDLDLPAGPPEGVDAAELEGTYHTLLQRSRSQEIARGVTLVGPHRDELRFVLNDVDLGVYGSRGQQRTAVLALKLAELAWMEQLTGEAPVLLLDEVLAELDSRRRNYLLAQVGRVQQALLTTTDAEMFAPSFREQAALWRVQNGIVIPEG